MIVVRGVLLGSKYMIIASTPRQHVSKISTRRNMWSSYHRSSACQDNVALVGTMHTNTNTSNIPEKFPLIATEPPYPHTLAWVKANVTKGLRHFLPEILFLVSSFRMQHFKRKSAIWDKLWMEFSP